MKLKAPVIQIKEIRRRFLHLGFFKLLILALVISFLPYLGPFEWMETFFHEISHGMTAILSGGEIISIELNWDGSGLCTTRGGFAPLTTFSGYIGASLWGAFIYLLATRIRQDYAFISGIIVAIFLIICMVLWAKDITTLIILLILLLPFALIYFTKKIWVEALFMQFSGLYTLIISIKSPLFLIDGKSIGDGAALENATGVPEIIWIMTWVIFSALILGATAILSKNP